MKSPRPCSYHQNAIAVAIRTASRALAMRLRSSVRWATRVIVACGSRGVRRRRTRAPRPASLTVVPPGAGGSADAVDRAGVVGAGPELGGAQLGGAGLVLQLGGQVTTRGRPRGQLTADRRCLGGVLGGDVVGLHALHLALEDAQ